MDVNRKDRSAAMDGSSAAGTEEPTAGDARHDPTYRPYGSDSEDPDELLVPPNAGENREVGGSTQDKAILSEEEHT